MTIGKCPHGEFELAKGCPQCIEARLKTAKAINLEAGVCEAEVLPISISGGIPEGMKIPESVTTTSKPDYFDQPSNYTFNEVAKLVEEGRIAGGRELANRLGVFENDMGFCEISNHVPYQEFKEWGVQYG